MEALHLYMDSNDIDKYIHSKLSPEDAEKYKDTTFLAYQSELNKNDMSIDIHIAVLSPEQYDKISREKIDIDEFISNISNPN